MNRKRQVVISAAIGGGLELFDFVIYLFLSPIIALNFFPHGKGSAAFLITLAGFAVGYLARPVGGIIYGHFGDRIGRKRTLASSLLFMAIPTLLIGCMPTYAVIGILAPTLLITLRFIQGLALGGDIPGAICFIGEHIQPRQRGFMTSCLIFGVNMGATVGSAFVAGLSSLLTSHAMINWGWRIPFLMGSVLAIVGFYVRHRTFETPEFEQKQKEGMLFRWPLKELLCIHGRSIGFGFIATALAAVATATLSLFMSSYLSNYTGIRASVALWLSSGSICVYSLTCLGIGLLIDRFNSLRIMQMGAIAILLFAYPIFILVSSHSIHMIIIGLTISAPILASIMGSLPTVLLELFPTAVRYSGIGISYNFGFSLFGGTAPLIAVFLISATGLKTAPAFFVMIAAGLTLMPLLLMQRKRTPTNLDVVSFGNLQDQDL